MQSIEIVDKVCEIVRGETESPAEELRKIGRALMKIGDALEGRSITEARGIMEMVRQAELIRRGD